MSNLPKAIKQPVDSIKSMTKNEIIIKCFIFIGLFLATLMFFAVNVNTIKYNLKAGDVAYDDIFAPSQMVDKAATEQRRELAEDSVAPEYEYDLTVQIEITKKLDIFFTNLDAIKNNENMDFNQKLSYFEQQSNISLSNDKYNLLLKSSAEDINKLKFNINYIVTQILGQNITIEQLEEKREKIKEFFDEITEESKLNSVGADIAIMLLRPNKYLNEEKTEAKKLEAREKVEEVTIKKGTKIVNKGQEVTLQHIQLLEAYGLLENSKGQFDIILYLGYSIVILLGILILCLYIFRFERKIWNNNSSLFLLSLMMFGAMVISVYARVVSDYFIVLPAFVMVLSVMLSPRAAVVTSVIATIFIGFVSDFDISIFIILLMAGIAGSMLVYKTHHRSSIIYAGMGISMICILLILSFGLIDHTDWKSIFTNMIYGLGGGVLSSILTIGTLPFLEATFDIITPIKLLELSNPNQPLLRRLLIEAPGTYYHSILVGNLSEAAAEEVGANSLLCRIGSYFHDIGKLKRPYFFKENQITKENPHDKITPNLSALIITSHIKDGIELAKKYKLPSSVINIIRQHHGNTLVAYFYHKALNTEGGEQVTEDKFRYPYLKPQTKEAAIVMLADSVEAYIRSLTEPTQEQVEQGVRKIIKDKLQDGQLEQCELTLKDMENIAKAFVKVLAGIFHDRIEYPETIKDI